MRMVYTDAEAVRFVRETYAVNVFWCDVLGGRGFRFFMHQLVKGVRALV